MPRRGKTYFCPSRGFGTLRVRHAQVAGLRRASPSAALDKHVYTILYIILYFMPIFNTFFQKRKKAAFVILHKKHDEISNCVKSNINKVD